MVLINCYYYIINIDLSLVSIKYVLKPTDTKINGEIVYDLVYKKLEDSFYNLNLF